MDAKVGRKLLQGGIKEEYIERDGKKTLLTPKMTTVAVPAGLVLCCGLLCSCFRAKKKQTDANVLAKEPSSSKFGHTTSKDTMISLLIFLLLTFTVHFAQCCKER